MPLPPTDRYFYIKRVVSGGPAWAAGLAQGDMLMEIGGVDLRPLDKEQLPGLVVGPEGSTVSRPQNLDPKNQTEILNSRP